MAEWMFVFLVLVFVALMSLLGYFLGKMWGDLASRADYACTETEKVLIKLGAIDEQLTMRAKAHFERIYKILLDVLSISQNIQHIAERIQSEGLPVKPTEETEAHNEELREIIDSAIHQAENTVSDLKHALLMVGKEDSE